MRLNLAAICGVFFSVVGITSVFLPWATVPMAGEVAGIHSNEGIVTLISFGVLVILFATSGNNKNKIFLAILSLIGIIAGIYYLVGFSSIINRVKSVGNIKMWGMSIGNLFDDGDFVINGGVYLQVFAGIMCLILSFFAGAVVTFDDSDLDYQPHLEKEVNVENDNLNFTNHSDILESKLELLNDLKKKNLISEELHEKESKEILNKYGISFKAAQQSPAVSSQINLSGTNDNPDEIKFEKNDEPVDVNYYTPSMYSNSSNRKGWWVAFLALIILGLLGYFVFKNNNYLGKPDFNSNIDTLSSVKNRGESQKTIANDWLKMNLQGDVKSLRLERDFHSHGSDRDYKILFNRSGNMTAQYFYDNDMDLNPGEMSYYFKYHYTNGLMTRLEFFNHGDILNEYTNYKYSKDGNKVEELVRKGNGSFVSLTKFKYDSENKLKSVVNCDVNGYVLSEYGVNGDNNEAYSQVKKNKHGDVVHQDYDNGSTIDKSYKYDSHGNWVECIAIINEPKRYGSSPIKVNSKRVLIYY